MENRIQEIYELNRMIEHASGTKGDINAQWDLVKEEYKELNIEVESKNYEQAKKEICDCIVVLTGLAYKMGIDLNQELKNVNQQNMEKFVATIEEAQETFDYYTDKGLSVAIRPVKKGAVAIISLTNQKDDKGREYPKGKLLKPVHMI